MQSKFSSEIINRSRLHGHPPVITIRDQKKPLRIRATAILQIPSGLRSEIHWQRSDDGYCAKNALLSNLSDEAARVFARSQPNVEALSIKIAPPVGL
ncbi:MAG: hypothetical protein CME28_00500 [Gemmatimonadetes bacterium]|nr:hypothetical protein [Gemmatimonadota bacterium]